METQEEFEARGIVTTVSFTLTLALEKLEQLQTAMSAEHRVSYADEVARGYIGAAIKRISIAQIAFQDGHMPREVV
jgi:hypothetical protein